MHILDVLKVESQIEETSEETKNNHFRPCRIKTVTRFTLNFLFCSTVIEFQISLP